MKVVALRDAAKVTMGTAPPGSSYNVEGVGMPMIAGAGDYGDIYPNPKKWTTEPTQVAEPGDIIVCVRATIGDLNWADKEYCLGRGVAGVRPYVDRLDSRYASHYISTKKVELSKLGTGSTFLAIRRGDLEGFPIPLPPLPEQKRIAGILDAADALRAKRREALAQLDTLLQSTFLHMFGDPVTNPMGWDLVALTKIGEFISGATPSKAHDDYWIGSTPWVSPKDMKVSKIFDAQDHVSDSAFVETNLKLLQPGHLLIVVRGMILAHSFPVAVNLVPVAINQDMKAIRPSERFEVCYLLECMRQMTRQILSEVSTAGHGTKRFDGEAMKKILVPVPPLDLQRRFAVFVELIEQQRARMRAHLAELDALFASLQSRAFNGEL